MAEKIHAIIKANMVEIFFGIITRQAIRRGTFRSVHELTGAIRRYIDACNTRAKPFVRTRTADQSPGPRQAHTVLNNEPSSGGLRG